MTLQALEYFIAVARYRNFTRAAEACYVTQPALSRAIKDLEEEMGCMLLLRSGRTVTLTPEGEVCMEEAVKVLRRCEVLAERVREAGKKNQKPLRMGYVVQSHLNAFFRRLQDDESKEMPPIQLDLEYGGNADIKKRFYEGELDLILIPEVCIDEPETVEIVRIQKNQAYALLYKTHSLYEKERVNLAELKDVPLVLWDEKNYPRLNAEYEQMFVDKGYMPHVVGRAEKTGNLMALVASHNAAGIMSNATTSGDLEDFRRVLIEDSPSFGLCCIWRKDDPSPQLAMLKKLLTQTDV